LTALDEAQQDIEWAFEVGQMQLVSSERRNLTLTFS
jgi:hypothetical protein